VQQRFDSRAIGRGALSGSFSGSGIDPAVGRGFERTVRGAVVLDRLVRDDDPVEARG
jgi:hypothetical protein